MKHVRILCISIMVTLASGLTSPVFASDIDMFWDSGYEADITNVLFMIDNSALMTEATTGSTDTRLDVVKEGIVDGLKLLVTQSNLSVAIGRFTQDGTDASPNTPILFPFTQVQTALELIGDSRAIAVGILSSNDDAMEAVSGSTVSSLADTVLQLDKEEVIGFQTVSSSAVAQYQGIISLARNDNVWSYSVQYIGGNKSLVSLDFSALTCFGDSPDVSVNGVAQAGLVWTGSSASSADDFIVSLTYDNQYASTDQTIRATDALTSYTDFSIKGPDCIPTSDLTDTAINPQKIGIRFTSVDIPPGARIESATLQFVSATAAASGTLSIQADMNSGDDFAGAKISVRTSLSTAIVNWETTAWEADKIYPCDDGTATCATDQENADISTVIQEIVDTSWSCGDEVAFIITGSAGAQHKIKSFDNADVGKAPVLNIEYTLDDGVSDCVYTPRISMISPVEKAIQRLSVPPGSSAPLANGIEEAVLYFKGDYIDNGLTRSDNPLYFVSHPDTYLGGILSDTVDDCQEVYESGKGAKTTICHAPSVRPANTHTLRISQSLWPTPGVSPIADDTIGVCTSDVCKTEEITNSPIYSCNGYIVEPTEMMTICKSIDNGDGTFTAQTLDIPTSDWPAAKANYALPGECLVLADLSEFGKKVPICHIAQGNQNILPQDPSINSIEVAHFSHPQYFDSIRQEKYGCDYNPVIQTIPADTSCTIDGTNCIVLIAGPGQDTSWKDTIEIRLEGLTDENINTMTIGVDVNIDAQTAFLDALGLAGGAGTSKNAITALEMKAVVSNSITRCFGGSSRGNGAVYSASVSLNRFDNNKSHHPEVYYAFTQPGAGALWDGNLKKFYMVGDAVCENNISPCPADENLFSDGYGALSMRYGIVTEGGAGILLDSTYRNISANYPTVEAITRLDAGATVPTGLSDYFTDVALADSTVTEQEADRVKINNGMIGLDTYGVDYSVPSDPTAIKDRVWLFADMLHSKANVIHYTESDIGVLVATNDGLVHLFDGTYLDEKWAFAPEALLSRQKGYVSDSCNNSSHGCYGVDSTLNVIIKDINNDGIGNDTDDSVQVFFGLGQGGTGFYALDITNFSATQPTFKWFLDDNIEGFSQLGQTWTAPVNAVVDSSYCNGSAPCNAMLLSGGYDSTQDGGEHGFKFATSTTGNALYMLAPDTGSQLGSFENMNYAIVAEVKTLDENKNGIIDTLYMGNVGGEIVRVDLTDGDSHTEGTHIVAQLSTEGVAECLPDAATPLDPIECLEGSERSFFEPIDVMRTTIDAAKVNVVVALTGTRPAAAAAEYPVEDKLYVFLDDKASSTLTNPEILHPVSRTGSYSPDYFVNRLLKVEGNVPGWVLSLEAHEMGIGSPVILRDVPEEGTDSISFNTFNGVTSESRLYMVNLLNGDPVAAKNADGIFELNTPIIEADDLDLARYQIMSNRSLGSSESVKDSNGNTRLLTSDGLLSLPGAANTLPKITPANWKQVY